MIAVMRLRSKIGLPRSSRRRPPRQRFLVQLAIVVVVLLAACTVNQGASRNASEAATNGTPHTASSGGSTLVWEASEGIRQPTGVGIATDGSLFVVDYGLNMIMHIGADGRTLGHFGKSGSGPGQLAQAAGIAVAQDGTLFVADHNNYRIEKFSPAGRYVLAWGDRGSGQGQFDGPDGVAVSPTGEVYVSEDKNARIQVFSQDGRFIRSWKGDPTDPFGDPTGIAFIGNLVLVADYQKSSISVFDSTGKPIRTIGNEGSGPGEFAGISMIATDAARHIFATDYNNGRILEFDAGGRLVATILLPNGARFRLPWGLAVTDDGDLVVAEFEAGRVVRISPAS